MYSEETLIDSKILRTSEASSSCPVTPIRNGLAPRPAIFAATFAAPPATRLVFSRLTTGTGASGEIRRTLPHQYLSSITSPITRTFISEKFSIMESNLDTGVLLIFNDFLINYFAPDVTYRDMCFLNPCRSFV